MHRKVVAAAALFGIFGLVAAVLTVQSPGTAQAQQASHVTIMNFSFQPGTLTVPPGTTVSWTNQDSATHTATSDTGAWDTGNVPQGTTKSVAFSQPGTYPYHCAIHPGMHGSIVVQSAAGATPGPTATGIPLAAYPVASLRKTIKASEVNSHYVFAPARTSIAVGTKVTWTNGTDAPHTVTAVGKGWRINKKFTPGAKVTYVFSKAGVFRYKCIYHTGMVGTVTVHM